MACRPGVANQGFCPPELVENSGAFVFSAALDEEPPQVCDGALRRAAFEGLPGGGLEPPARLARRPSGGGKEVGGDLLGIGVLTGEDPGGVQVGLPPGPRGELVVDGGVEDRVGEAT